MFSEEEKKMKKKRKNRDERENFVFSKKYTRLLSQRKLYNDKDKANPCDLLNLNQIWILMRVAHCLNAPFELIRQSFLQRKFKWFSMFISFSVLVLIVVLIYFVIPKIVCAIARNAFFAWTHLLNYANAHEIEVLFPFFRWNSTRIRSEAFSFSLRKIAMHETSSEQSK